MYSGFRDHTFMKRVLVLIFFIVFLTIVLFVTTRTKAQGADLFISEYVEGSSYNKAIEIFNPANSPVDLDNYEVDIYHNGALTASSKINLPIYNIASDGVYIICDSSVGPDLLPKCNLLNGSLDFNGDDAITLAKTDGTVIDVIGQIGVDPGTEWGTGLNSTQDNTLRRKCLISMGDPNGSDTFDPGVEWDGYAVDNFDNLGTHTLCLPTSEPSAPPTLIPTNNPTETSAIEPTAVPSPTEEPTAAPTETPTDQPTITPSPVPSQIPTASPTASPSPTPKSDHDSHYNHWFKEFYDRCGKFIRDNYRKWPSHFKFLRYNNHR
jgi:uncharacterized protein